MDKTEIYENSIILIGPIGVGKSSVCELLSNSTGLYSKSLDYLRKEYFPKYGFNKEYSVSLLNANEIKKWHEYQKPFELKLVKDVINSLTVPAIIDFGGTQSYYLNLQDVNELRKTLKPFKNVFYLKFPKYAYEYAKNFQSLNKTIMLSKQNESVATNVFECDIFKLNNNAEIVTNFENGKNVAIVDYYKTKMLEQTLLRAYSDNRYSSPNSINLCK